MNGTKRAKKSGRNVKNTAPAAEIKPQLYDLTQGMPPAEDAAAKSEIDVFRPNPAQVSQPVQVPSPVQVQVPQPIQVPPPVQVQVPQPIQVPPPVQVQVPQPIQVPPPVQVQVPQPIQVPPPVQMQVPQPIQVPPPVQVQAPQPVQIQVPPPLPESPAELPAAEMPAASVQERNAHHTSGQENAHTPAQKRHRNKQKSRREKSGKSDLSQVYDYVNGRKQLDLPEGVQGTASQTTGKTKKRKPYVPVKQGSGKTRPETLREERMRRRKQEERLTYMIVACVILFLIASGFLLKILWNYRRTAAEYAGLTDTYVAQGSDDASVLDTGEELPYPPLEIDFPGLFALNSDLIAWIHVPVCDISYPIVQTTDNDYYLNHTFLKNLASGGAIFMDYGDHADFSDHNTFLYGHNMQDGSMFGTLHRLWQDEALVDKDPYFYVYLTNGSVRKYQIVSYYRDHGDSDSYLRMTTEEEKQNYADMILEKSAVNAEKSPLTASQTIETGDTLVTLSTCHGGVNTGQRFLVHGKLIGVY